MFRGRNGSSDSLAAPPDPTPDHCAALELEHDQLSSLEHWHVVHAISTSSPLWPIRRKLKRHLKAIDVSITAYDPAFNQEVKLYGRYSHEEVHVPPTPHRLHIPISDHAPTMFEDLG